MAGITPITLKDLEVAFQKARAKYAANPGDLKAKRVYREVGKQLNDARAAVRAEDPRRLRAHAESKG